MRGRISLAILGSTALLGLLLFLTVGTRDRVPEQLSADELRTLLETKEIFFLDVREPAEIAELGTIRGYVNIPVSQLEARLSEIPRDRLIVTA